MNVSKKWYFDIQWYVAHPQCGAGPINLIDDVAFIPVLLRIN